MLDSRHRQPSLVDAGYLNSGPHAKQAFLPTKILSQPLCCFDLGFLVLTSQRICEVGSFVENKMQSVFLHCLTSPIS